MFWKINIKKRKKYLILLFFSKILSLDQRYDIWYAKLNKASLKGVSIMKVEKIIKIGDEKYFYATGYYSQNKFIDNDTVVLVRSEEEKIGQAGSDPDKKIIFWYQKYV